MVAFYNTTKLYLFSNWCQVSLLYVSVLNMLQTSFYLMVLLKCKDILFLIPGYKLLIVRKYKERKNFYKTPWGSWNQCKVWLAGCNRDFKMRYPICHLYKSLDDIEDNGIQLAIEPRSVVPSINALVSWATYLWKNFFLIFCEKNNLHLVSYSLYTSTKLRVLENFHQVFKTESTCESYHWT